MYPHFNILVFVSPHVHIVTQHIVYHNHLILVHKTS